MTKNSERREAILENIVDVLLRDGLSELSLRPLAEKVGSSARLLIYHFGSKDALVKAALVVVHERAEQSLRALRAQTQPADLRGLLLMFWAWAIEAANQKYFRLMFEADGLAMHDRQRFSEDFKDEGGLMWLRMIDNATAHLPPDAGRSSLIMAALNGLLQDFFSTGDQARIQAGLDYLIRVIA